MQELHKFLAVQGEHFLNNITSAEFQGLVPPVSNAYNIANRVLPAETSLAIRKMLLLCDRALLVAVSLIASGNPDDSVPVTRRAIEIARTAFALTYDKNNLAGWLAEEKRKERWEARNKGAKPPHLHITYKLPSPHELLERLGMWQGILSDAASHCTPEYLSGYEWERRGDSAFLGYVITDRDHVLRTLRVCVAIHLKILLLFDEIFKGALRANKEWCEAMSRILAAGADFPPPTLDAAT